MQRMCSTIYHCNDLHGNQYQNKSLWFEKNLLNRWPWNFLTHSLKTLSSISPSITKDRHWVQNKLHLLYSLIFDATFIERDSNIHNFAILTCFRSWHNVGFFECQHVIIPWAKSHAIVGLPNLSILRIFCFDFKHHFLWNCLWRFCCSGMHLWNVPFLNAHQIFILYFSILH